MATSTLGSGTLVLAGTTSGTTTVTATAVAGTTTLTLPAATDTLVGRATTDTLTNKTLTGAAMNGTVGATTPASGAFTTLSATGVTTVQAGTAAAPAITTTGDTNTGIFFPAADTIAFAEGGAESMRLDSAGNMGLGVTPSAWTGAFKVLEIGSKGGALAGASGEMDIFNNAYNNGSNYIYGISSYATQFQMNNLGQFRWYNAPSGTAGNAITFTQAMTLDASGNLIINDTSRIGSARLSMAVNASTENLFAFKTTTNGEISALRGLNSAGSEVVAINYDTTNSALLMRTGSTERARIDSSGNLLVGTTSGTNHIIYKNAAVAARIIAFQGENSGAYTSVAWATADNQGWNGANTVEIIGKNTGTGRSINAAGTINASGADYAEYMTKAGNFTVAKGDVVGINAQGKLTNVFANAISFVVKSTDPSYVGGDSWGVGFEDDAVGLEAARQLVDRIAFAGQVPVNVTGATAGQYIIPVNDNGAIKGEAVSNPTFEQYQTAVGKVIAIESDGRAKIIVKVA
jgi:hypothetical protein